MCACSQQQQSFTGNPAPCGCGGHASFDGTGLNNEGDTLTPDAAMQLVEQLLVSPVELAGLTTAEANALKTDRYAKMRYYFDVNSLSLTQANIITYQKSTMLTEGSPMLLARHPYLKTAGFLLVLLALTLTGLYFLTQEA